MLLLGLAQGGAILFHQTNALFCIPVLVVLLASHAAARRAQLVGYNWRLAAWYGGALALTVGLPYLFVGVVVSGFRGWGDFVAWLTEYARFMPTGFTPLTGSDSAIRSTADAWGIRYAREEAEEGEGEYSMSHTADVFLVDGSGMRRATFPFGTSSDAMTR